MGSIGRSIAPQGVKFNGSLQSYLATKQPHSLCIFWARRKADSVDPNPANIVGSYAGATLNNNLGISAPSAGQSFIMRFGGVITTQLAFATPFGQLAQIAIEFNGIGQPVNLYKDGAVFSTPSFGSATGFVASDSMVIGKHDWGDPSRTALYRMIVEDLAVSGRSALSVVQKDYNYVKATGDFAGIVKRPFVDAF